MLVYTISFHYTYILIDINTNTIHSNKFKNI